MERIVFLNGEYLAESRARVSVFDRGFLYGDTVYETLRAHRGRLVFWNEHLDRLRRSCELVYLEIPWGRFDLEKVAGELLRRNRLEEARIRITLSRGVGGPDQLEGFEPTWVVTAVPTPLLPEALYEDGVEAVLVHVSRIGATSIHPEVKSGNYLNNLLARREARLRGAFEGVMLNPLGAVAEGASCNVFWTRDGVLETPSPEVGILLGITRAKLLSLAPSTSGISEVREVSIGPERLADAAEVFLTSTTWEVLPVTRWEGREVGAGKAGPIARRLRERLQGLYPRGPSA